MRLRTRPFLTMSTYAKRGRNEATPPQQAADAPLRFSFDLTPAATERTRLLALIPYPIVRAYLWFRGGVAVGLSALERSFKYLMVGLLGFIAGYSSYTSDYAAHLRNYWQATPVVAAIPEIVQRDPMADKAAEIVTQETPAPVEKPQPEPPKQRAAPVPRRVVPPVQPAPVAPRIAETPTALTEGLFGQPRDPNIPLFNLNRSPGEAIATTEPAGPTYDLRPIEERTLEHRQEAAATGKRILYYFSADWCLPCKVMESEVFTDTQVARMLRNEFVVVKSDIETLDGYEMKQHFGIESLPGFLVVDRYGRELGRARAAMPLSRFKAFLRAPSQVFTASTRPGPRLK